MISIGKAFYFSESLLHSSGFYSSRIKRIMEGKPFFIRRDLFEPNFVSKISQSL